MTNQKIIDMVEDALPRQLAEVVKDKILDAVWFILNDELGIDTRFTKTAVKTKFGTMTRISPK